VAKLSVIRLRTKLTVLYVALFVAALCLIGTSVYVVTRQNVERAVREQLRESGAVFTNLSAARNRRLQDEAEVLARDFGFRAAFATGDRATVLSALDNLSSRLENGVAFTVGLDGKVLASDPRIAAAVPNSLIQAVQGDQPVSGLTVMGGAVVQIVAAPILTPAPAGWVVFAKPMGAPDIAELEHLSPIPLQIAFLAQDAKGHWRDFDASRPLTSAQQPTELIRRSKLGASSAPILSPGPHGALVDLVLPLPSPDPNKSVFLLLSYPLSEAMGAYSGLIVTIVLIGVAGILLTVVGSWVLALTLTRPLSALQTAAGRLQRGEVARVAIDGRDEIALLGRAFNAMADDIKSREDNLVKARDEAEAASRAKTEFLSNMNHELRTPLNGVLAMASLLARDPLEARQRKMVDLIQRSGAELERVLADVLTLVEASAAKTDIQRSPFHLGDLVRASCASASALAKAKGLTFESAIAPSADRWVDGDAARLAGLLARLLDNAVKFTVAGVVRLDLTAADDGMYRIVVTDTGVGFEPADAERLFQAFYRADGSLTRSTGGLGVGLSLARDAARAMGGDIVGEGETGRGAIFTVVLPLPPAASPAAPATATDAVLESAPQADEAGPIRVLLADDHEGNRRIVELIMGQLGAEVTSVENGAQAVEAFKVATFDVVLMDLQMPVMDGLTAIAKIRSFESPMGQRTPIIVLSANAQSEHLAASAAAGADSHIAKPILAATLIAALEAALDDPGEAQTPQTQTA
jgi:signal transduction histidine kinase/AmiR/NasT family two-component response regulator